MVPHYFDLSYWKKPINGKRRSLRYRAGKVYSDDSFDRTTIIIRDDKSLNETVITNQNENFETSSENDETSVIGKSKPKKKCFNKKSSFILDEADVVDLSYLDEVDTQKLNKMDEIFVVSDNDDEIVMADDYSYSNYLKTTKNIVGPPIQNKYKLKYDYDLSLNVYSQRFSQINDEDNEYQMDSFCNDEIIYISDNEIIEQTNLSISKSSAKPRQKAISSTPINSKKKRRRIIIEEDDDD